MLFIYTPDFQIQIFSPNSYVTINRFKMVFLKDYWSFNHGSSLWKGFGALKCTVSSENVSWEVSAV